MRRILLILSMLTMSLPILGMQQAPDPILVAANKALTARSQLILNNRSAKLYLFENLDPQANILRIGVFFGPNDKIRAIVVTPRPRQLRVHQYDANALESSPEGRRLMTEVYKYFKIRN